MKKLNIAEVKKVSNLVANAAAGFIFARGVVSGNRLEFAENINSKIEVIYNGRTLGLEFSNENEFTLAEFTARVVKEIERA
ncbi:MAG: hypothetical protein ACRCX2_13560 [Paraclostridium sp.]